MNKDEIIMYLKKQPFIQPETPLGVVMDKHEFSIISKSNFIAVSVDNDDFIEIPKYEFMNSEELCKDTEFYVQNQDIESAQACIECALRVDDQVEEENKNWKVYFYAGFIALRQRIFDASINLIKRSIDLGCPELRKCYDYMAIASSILGRTEDAFDYYQMAIDETPLDPEVWHNIAGFYWDNNNLYKAVQSYIKALECNISYMPSYEELVNLTAQLNNQSISNIFKVCYSNNKNITIEQLSIVKKWVLSLENNSK